MVQGAVAIGLPLAALLRIGHRVCRLRRASYWTGTPILTLGRKAASERLLGVRALAIVRHTYRISDAFDIDLSRWSGGSRMLLYPLTCAVFLYMLVTAKRVHTFADAGLLPSVHRRRISAIELAAYRSLGIDHFVWTYGADVRTRTATIALGQPNCCTDCSQVGVACICDSSAGQRNLERLRKHGAHIFSMGDMTEYTPGSRNDLFFWPIDLNGDAAIRLQPAYPDPAGHGPLRVVHAANHRQFKGTAYLEAAVAQLRNEGVAIELVLVEGLPNDEALMVYRSADLVFDQCMIGFHGYFALEAMALGKPVMCFIRKPEQYLLAPQECPIINTSLGSLKDDLRALAAGGRPQLTELGRRGRRYVDRHFSPAAFANRLALAYSELGIEP